MHIGSRDEMFGKLVAVIIGDYAGYAWVKKI